MVPGDISKYFHVGYVRYTYVNEMISSVFSLLYLRSSVTNPVLTSVVDPSYMPFLDTLDIYPRT